MLLSYPEAVAKYGSDYQLKKAIITGSIFKIRPGVYAFDANADETAELFVKYDHIVLTLASAFYYHHVSDYVPDRIHVATPKNAYPIERPNVKQYFLTKDYYDVGIMEVKQDDHTIKVYDLERSLIELIRYQTKMPFEEYFHVLKNFREIADKMDFSKLTKYARKFKSYGKIINTVRNSIM
ncbi:MAG: type IV toxin-antitoxin system AbiEi family antitoxin [Candidatus Izemoplasmatales bacterium]